MEFTITEEQKHLQVAEMSVDLEAARLLTYHAAWLSAMHGPTAATLSALYRANTLSGKRSAALHARP